MTTVPVCGSVCGERVQTSPNGECVCPVVFDGGVPCENLRSDREVCQSPIDNTKEGIVNFGSNVNPFMSDGVFADFATIGGGLENFIGEDADFGTIAGGFRNRIEEGAEGGAIPGGTLNIVSGTNAFAAGVGSVAAGPSSAAFSGSQALGPNSFAEGVSVASGPGSHAEGGSAAIGPASHAETGATAMANNSHAEGTGSITEVFAPVSHAEGIQARTRLSGSHAHSPVETFFGTAGESQYTRWGLKGFSEAGDPGIMTGGLFEELTLEDNKVYELDFHIVARDSTGVPGPGTKWARWVITLLAYQDGGVAVVPGAGAFAPTEEDPGGSGWLITVTITVTPLGDTVRVEITGAPADAFVLAFGYVNIAELLG